MNESYLKSKLGIGVSFDVGFRELVVLKKRIQLYYVTGLVDTDFVIEIMKKN